MFIKKLPYILVTLLAAILIGCGSSNPMISDAESSLKDQNFDAMLSAAEKSIDQYPGDPLGYYYKGLALGELAGQKDNPEDRSDFYAQMDEAFETAKTVADTSENKPGELDRISGIKISLWQSEFQRAIDLATNDSVRSSVEEPMKLSLQHLRNATQIEPDSASTWNVRAQIASRTNNLDEAIDSKEKYMNMVPTSKLDTIDYVQMGSYYNTANQPKNAVKVLEEGQKRYPESRQIISTLANTYLQMGQSDKAITSLEDLVAQDPDNAEYRLVMASQIYQKALQMYDSVSANNQSIMELQQKYRDASDSEKGGIEDEINKLVDNNESLMDNIEELSNRSEKEVNKALEYNEEEVGAYELLGVIYRNKAQTTFDKRNRTSDNEEASKFDKQGKEYLRKAMNYYEKAVELDPENQNYWRSLFQIYTTLGMDKEAQEAMEKAGM